MFVVFLIGRWTLKASFYYIALKRLFFFLEETLQGDKCSLTKHTIGYNHLPVNNTTSAQMAFKPNFKKKLNKYLFLNASDNYA